MINEPPITTFEHEQKVLDTGLRMIGNFSGDSNDAVEEMPFQTNNLTSSVVLQQLHFLGICVFQCGTLA